MAYEIRRLRYDGAVDADGHVLEPADLWETYLEDRYRERAIRLRVDDDGFEYLEFDGAPSKRTVKGLPGLLGAMGEIDARPSPDRRYADNIPYGAGDPAERIALLDAEHLDAALLYPTFGLLWECEVTDPELTGAYQRAYNRWIADFCRDSGGRLVPVAQLNLLDPDWSAAELRRAVVDGCRGAFICPFTHTHVPPGHRDNDLLFATAVELDVPIAIHPTFEPVDVMPRRFERLSKGTELYFNVLVRQGVQQALLTFFVMGTLERFPTLKLGVLESGSGWVGSFLDRADAVWGTSSGRGARDAGLHTRPSEIFRRQCFVSGDPDETAAPLLYDHVGAHCFMWATDYPHPDHPGTWVPALERLVAGLSDDTRAAVLGGNVRRVYGVS